jgi:hypothetical protein
LIKESKQGESKQSQIIQSYPDKSAKKKYNSYHTIGVKTSGRVHAFKKVC